MQNAEFLRRLRSGEEGALRAMVRDHHAALQRFARAVVGDASAEEVVQEAWLKAIPGLRNFEGRASLRSWLLRIVRNEAVSRLRSEARKIATESADELDEHYGPDGSWRSRPGTWSADNAGSASCREGHARGHREGAGCNATAAAVGGDVEGCRRAVGRRDL